MNQQNENLILTSHWGVELEGDFADIERLQQHLAAAIEGPTSFFVSYYGRTAILRTAAWDCANTAPEAEQLARIDAAVLRGCLNASEGCAPLETGTIYEFTGDRIDMTRMSPVTVYMGPAGPSRLSPEQFKLLFAQARSSADLADAFAAFAPGTDWLSIYRSYEALKAHFGGESKLKRFFVDEGADIGRLRQTANSFRHHEAPPVADPMPYSEALVFLRGLLLRAAGAIVAW
jgi:hypothetical protein